MKVISPGHIYELDRLDADGTEQLVFVKREGPKFPGNKGHHTGTNLQEVLRVLIDRLKYLDNQVADIRNKACIENLRRTIWLLEDRAAERHNREFDFYPHNIELEPTCNKCGHIGCIGQCR